MHKLTFPFGQQPTQKQSTHLSPIINSVSPPTRAHGSRAEKPTAATSPRAAAVFAVYLAAAARSHCRPGKPAHGSSSSSSSVGGSNNNSSSGGCGTSTRTSSANSSTNTNTNSRSSSSIAAAVAVVVVVPLLLPTVGLELPQIVPHDDQAYNTRVRQQAE